MPTELTKKQRASQRNWNKARVMSMFTQVQEGVMTDSEKDTLYEIAKLRKKLLDNWDNNTIKLGFNHTPKKEIPY